MSQEGDTMDENERFKADILKQVNEVISEQHKLNKSGWDRFNSDLGHRLEVTLPLIIEGFTPKTNYGLYCFLAIINGVTTGLSIYAAMSVQ